MGIFKEAPYKYGKCLTLKTKSITVLLSTKRKHSNFSDMKSRKTYLKNIRFNMEMSFQLNTSADWSAYLKITSFVQMIRTFTSIRI